MSKQDNVDIQPEPIEPQTQDMSIPTNATEEAVAAIPLFTPDGKQAVAAVPLFTPDGQAINPATQDNVPVPSANQMEGVWGESEGWSGDGEDPFADIANTSSIPEQVNALETEISQLRQEMTGLAAAKTAAETAADQLKQEVVVLTAAKTEAETELNAAKLKNGKMLVKVKTLTKQVESLKSGSKSGGGASFMDDLDKTLEAEMKAQVVKAEGQLEEVRRELASAKVDKVRMEEKVDTLEAAHDRMLQMKESQDGEVSYLTSRVKQLKEETEGLRWQLEEVEERSRSEIQQLTVALSAYQSSETSSAGDIAADNARLKQEIAVTTTELSRVQESADKLREQLGEVSTQLKSALEEVASWKNIAEEAKEEMESMKLHLESLQSEKSSQGSTEEGDSNDQLKEKIRREQQLVLQLEMDLQMRDAALEQAREELEGLRAQGQDNSSTSMMARMRRDSTDSRLSDTFIEHQEVFMENNKLKGDLDHALRDNRRLSNRIRSWETELDRTQQLLDQEGLRAELTHAIETLQMKEHKLDEMQEENVSLLQERDSLQLRLSSLMRQMESAANSRAMTPVPGGGAPSPGGYSLSPLDSQQQIMELNSKLSELRKLNYALDVELQKERGQRVQQNTRIMEPRAREADRMLSQQTSGQQPTDGSVKHF